MLVYGYEPSGHAAAALALEEAARARGLLVSRVEVSADHHPAAALAVARGYHALLRAIPGVWGALYRSDAARAALRATRAAYLGLGGARRLLAGVRRRGADVVVCPQASVAAVFAAARLRGELDVPVVSVLTDYGAHPFWADPPADLILAPGASAAGELATAGVPPSRVRVTGIPIHPAFAAPPSRADARRALALPASAPVVLLSGGSHGHGDLDRAAAALLAASPRARVLALCGRNERLRFCLTRCAESGDRLRAFGPQPPALVAAMLAASDVHLGKPGGLTVAESLAAGVPMVLTRALPGQEEANARHLLDAGAALDGGSQEQAALVAATLLAQPRLLSVMSEAARGVARPDAADAAVGEIAGLLESSAAALS